MALIVLALVAVLIVLVWWTVQRAVRLRREAEAREAQMLEALFAARHSTAGGAHIDLDSIFGEAPADAASAGTEAILRSAVLQSGALALIKEEPHEAATAKPSPSPAPRADDSAQRTGAERGAAGGGSAGVGEPPSPPTPAPVRELVRAFYEARGFRGVLAEGSAWPVELVLEHKSDRLRAYAFVPLAGPLTETELRAAKAAARRIGQPRLLIASEGAVAPELGSTLPAQGVRAFDRPAIEAQLARIDATVAERIRAVALRRAARRPAPGNGQQ